MIRVGTPPYLECSSKGDRRFSAFYARPKSLNGRSIEEAYQAMKVFEDGTTGLSWREAKGRHALNQDACNLAYLHWWMEWIDQEDLLPILHAATGLSDVFGQDERTCQALTLFFIRCATLPPQSPS